MLLFNEYIKVSVVDEKWESYNKCSGNKKKKRQMLQTSVNDELECQNDDLWSNGEGLNETRASCNSSEIKNM